MFSRAQGYLATIQSKQPGKADYHRADLIKSPCYPYPGLTSVLPCCFLAFPNNAAAIWVFPGYSRKN